MGTVTPISIPFPPLVRAHMLTHSTQTLWLLKMLVKLLATMRLLRCDGEVVRTAEHALPIYGERGRSVKGERGRDGGGRICSQAVWRHRQQPTVSLSPALIDAIHTMACKMLLFCFLFVFCITSGGVAFTSGMILGMN